MKRLILLMCLFAALGKMVYAQPAKTQAPPAIDLPAEVKKAFGTKYKMAKKVVWTSNEENQYRSDFVMNEKKMAVVYDQAGKMLFTETELTENMYNKMALKYIKENYDAKYKIAYMRKVDTYDKKTTFIAMLKKGKELLEVEFDKKGNFIRDTDKTPATVSKKPAKKKKEEKEEEDEDEDVDKPQPEKSKSSKSKKKAKEDEEEEEE